jgi:erythromycin esterase
MKQEQETYHLNNSIDLDPLLERVGDAHAVLLGEATHGTHEFYTWRTAITKRLIVEKGFNFIAVEGDWPDCYKINRYVKGLENQDKQPEEILRTFDRWPTWMWANWEIVALVTWLKAHNEGLPLLERVGFYGLDVYSLWESMNTIVDYLEKEDPVAAELAKKAIQCFEPYGQDEHRYAREQYTLSASCREPLIRLLTQIRRKVPDNDHDHEAALNASQNVHIAVNAEAYYTNMTSFNDNSWNMRDTHMMETLERLFQFYGPESKAVVWEHNTHIGDARYTDMKKAGMINVGQLVREKRGADDVVLVGFGSFQGTVIAGRAWSAPMQEMTVPQARPGSIEAQLNEEYAADTLLIFKPRDRQAKYYPYVQHRAIGVVYKPETEKFSNYVPTILNLRYDAFLYIDQTQAIHPLHLVPSGHKIPETYPFEY